MTKLLLALLLGGAQLAFLSCTTKGVALSPLTETERQGLGTIGIAAELSKLDTWYAPDPSLIDDGLRAMQDRLNDAGQGAIDGAKRVYRDPIGTLSCRNSSAPGTACLVTVIGVVLLKGVVMTGGAIVGGVVGAIDRKTYSNPPLMELPERAVIRAVQESIDAVGLPERLRDQVWERAQTYQAYHFERLTELQADPPKTQGEYHNREKGARYWPLRDKGIQTLLKVRIQLIEFHGSTPEDSFRLFVHVETTLLSTTDQSCLRHRIWEFEGGSHRIDEWRDNDATLLINELDRGLPLIAQQVTASFFEQPSLFSFSAPGPVTLKSDSLDCRG